jgi:hypothetical protein
MRLQLRRLRHDLLLAKHLSLYCHIVSTYHSLDRLTLSTIHVLIFRLGTCLRTCERDILLLSLIDNLPLKHLILMSFLLPHVAKLLLELVLADFFDLQLESYVVGLLHLLLDFFFAQLFFVN